MLIIEINCILCNNAMYNRYLDFNTNSVNK